MRQNCLIINELCTLLKCFPEARKLEIATLLHKVSLGFYVAEATSLFIRTLKGTRWKLI